MNDLDSEYSQTVTYQDIINRKYPVYLNGDTKQVDISSNVQHMMDRGAADRVLQEKYDMTLEELGEFIEKYEPERTI